MATAIPLFYEDDDSTPAATIDFGELTPGTPSDEYELHLFNAHDGEDVDDMDDIFVSAMAKYPGDTSYTYENPVSAMRMVQVRVSGVVGSEIEDQVSPVTPVGKGRWLSLLSIPKGCARKIFVSVLPAPGNGNQTAVSVKLTLRWAGPSIALEMGHYEAGAQGVLTGAADGGMTAILSGGVATESGTPDEFVTFSDTIGIYKGEKYAHLEDKEEFTDEDSASATLASGEAYPCTVSVKANGARTQTKGPKATAPLDPDSWPTVPAGEKLLAKIAVPFGLEIDQSLIDQDDLSYGFHSFSFDGLDATIHGGVALIDNFLVSDQTRTIVTLDDDATQIVWRNGSGAFDKTSDGTRPTERALPLFEATTASGVVTSFRDLRPWIGPRTEHIRFVFPDTLAADQYAYAIYPHACDGSLRLANPVLAALDSVGTGSGGTIFDVQYYDDDGLSWVSFFTSAELMVDPVDRRPAMSVGGVIATSVDAVPEVYPVRGFSRLRAKVVDVPSSIKPTYGVVDLIVEIAA